VYEVLDVELRVKATSELNIAAESTSPVLAGIPVGGI